MGLETVSSNLTMILFTILKHISYPIINTNFSPTHTKSSWFKGSAVGLQLWAKTNAQQTKETNQIN